MIITKATNIMYTHNNNYVKLDQVKYYVHRVVDHMLHLAANLRPCAPLGWLKCCMIQFHTAAVKFHWEF